MNKTQVSLVVGHVTFDTSPDSQNHILVYVANKQVLRIRKDSKALGYLRQKARYALAYVNKGEFCVITLVKHNPTIGQFLWLMDREESGSLPAREIRKRKN